MHLCIYMTQTPTRALNKNSALLYPWTRQPGTCNNNIYTSYLHILREFQRVLPKVRYFNGILSILFT